jgi:Serine dehydrogenase proteinase
LSKEERIVLIKRIEEKRKSRLITYLTGDRDGYSIASIQEDVLPKFDEILRRIGTTETIDLLLYSRGGATHVPWKVVALIREHCKTFNVLIPFRAHSAATMIALGADSIVCGQAAELGPIDPSLTTQFGPKDKAGNPIQVGSETINSYVSFLNQHLKLEKPDVARDVDILINATNPLAIGEIYRLHNYIRLTSRRLLESSSGVKKEAHDGIIKALVEEMYYHGHAITRKDAKKLGLNIVEADAALETDMWSLFTLYSAEMKLGSTFNRYGFSEGRGFAVAKDVGTIAYLESSDLGYRYEVELVLEPKRLLPQGVNLNVNVQVPPNLLQAAGQNPQLQALLSQMVQAALPQVQQQVLAQLNAQAPVVDVDIKASRNDWVST